MKVAYVLVCQAGPIEPAAALLCASLRRFGGLGFRSEIVAMVPGPSSITGNVQAETLELLESIGVRVVHRVNEHLIACGSPREVDFITNKFCCLDIDTECERIVFLDSDQVCHREFDKSLFSQPVVGGRVGYTGARVVNTVYDNIYELCGTKPPGFRMKVGTPQDSDASVYIPPAFNTGLISVVGSQVPNLVRTWRECFYRLDQSELELGDNKFYAEQVAFGVAVEKAQIPYLLVDSDSLAASILHYHSPERLRGYPQILSRIRALMDEYELLEHVFRQDSEWSDLLSVPVLATKRPPVSKEAAFDASELWFPTFASPDASRMRFVKRPSDFFQRYPFHDDRLLKEIDEVKDISIAVAEQIIEEAKDEPRRFIGIFHTAFCGSTLLAKYLHQLGHCQFYLEPELFTQLAVQKWFGFKKWCKSDWDRILRLGMHFLSRGTARELIPGIKFHDSATNLTKEFLDWHSDSRAIVLYSSLEDFLLSNLKDVTRRAWVRTRLSASCGRSFSVLRDVQHSQLTDAQACAYLWIAQIHTCRTACVEHGGRILSLKSESLFEAPYDSLVEIGKHVGIPSDAPRFEQAIMSQSRVHAKTLQRFETTAKRETEGRLRRELRAEFEQGMEWAAKQTKWDVTNLSLPNTLNVQKVRG